MKGLLVRPLRLVALASLLGTTVATASMPALQAHAVAPLAAAISCTTSLVFPGGGSSECDGTSVGISSGGNGVGAFQATFNYSEPCPPVTGNASGDIYVNGNHVATFTWLRAGLTAIVTLHPDGGIIGAAAGLFVPLGLSPSSLSGSCPPSNVTAHVVALGAGV